MSGRHALESHEKKKRRYSSFTNDPFCTSVANLAATSFARDMVFSDGDSYELATLSGDSSAGYTAKLTIAI